MISTSFDEETGYLNRPTDMTADQCDVLSVAKASLPDGTPVVISCWKLTKEESEEFHRTGRIWLIVIGRTMPPVALSGIKPFATEGSQTSKTESDM